MIVDVDGNVGIGTANPAADLHVKTTGEGVRIEGSSTGASNTAWLSFSDAAGTALGYVGDGSQGDSDMYVSSYTGNVYLYTPFGASLTARSNGNVGIGTTNPASKLDVQGDTRVSGTLAVNSGQISLPATTRSYILHAYDFRPKVPGTSVGSFYFEDDGLHDRSGLSAQGYADYVACVHLPDGATIIAMELWGHDGWASRDMTCTIGRTNVSAGTLEMGTIVTNVGSGPAWQTTSILFPTVDNDTHAYWIRARLSGSGGSLEHILTAVRIIYQITQPLP
ncbi:MAG: hypothetical protein R3E12_05070 [Candidatus Eisenbacteria bacterium]